MPKAAEVRSIRPDSFLQVSLNEDLCFSCPGTFSLSSYWWGIVKAYSATLLACRWEQTRPSDSTESYPECLVLTDIRRSHGACAAFALSVFLTYDGMCCVRSSSASFMQSASEGSIPVNSDITHTVPKFSELGGHQYTASACKPMRII